MYKLIVKNHFDAAHRLLGYEGKCAAIHGHTWYVEVCFQSEELNKIGISFDFRALKGVLKEILEEFDHTNLNELKYFKVINPTAENMAALIYEKAKEKAAEMPGCKLVEVKIWESPNACCVYSE